MFLQTSFYAKIIQAMVSVRICHHRSLRRFIWHFRFAFHLYCTSFPRKDGEFRIRKMVLVVYTQFRSKYFCYSPWNLQKVNHTKFFKMAYPNLDFIISFNLQTQFLFCFERKYGWGARHYPKEQGWLDILPHMMKGNILFLTRSNTSDE